MNFTTAEYLVKGTNSARTGVEHVDRSSALRWRSLSYKRGGIAALGLNVSWDAIREVRGRVVEVEYTETPGGEIYNYSLNTTRIRVIH